MRISLLAAAAVAGFTTVVHVVGGGETVHIPIQLDIEDPALKAIATVIWHGITAILAITTAALLWCAMSPNRPLEVTMLIIQVSFIGLFVFYGLTRLGDVIQMPQWTLFAAISFAILLGWRRRDNA